MKVGKKEIVSFCEREKRLSVLEEDKVQLTCGLCMVSVAVFVKVMYYENLFLNQKAGMDKTVEDTAGQKVKREIDKQEKKQIKELKIKQVDKLIQTVELVPLKVSLISVETDKVVPTVPVVVEGATRALYASVANQVSMQVAALASVGLVLLLTGARALVVHGMPCRQLVADILWQAQRLRLWTSKRILDIYWLLEGSRRRYMQVSSIVIYFSSIVLISGRYNWGLTSWPQMTLKELCAGEELNT